MRACISAMLSPFGKRARDGAACTTFHRSVFASSAIVPPVQSPYSASMTPSSVMTGRSCCAAIAAAVCCVRSIGLA